MAHNSGQGTSRFTELEYRRKWLHQLQSEFRLICSWYRISLAAPAFRITDSKTMLGSWNPDTRTISISAILISEYSWDAVINVLKHEMAHQYVHEFMGRTIEQPHGPSFQKACENLGVLVPFNSAGGDTPKAFSAAEQHCSNPEYDRKVEKVRKMLSLAGSGNRHEAAAAMRTANRFIRKYNIERLHTNAVSRYSYEIINRRKKRLHIIERRIASLLMDYFYVDIVYSELFDPESDTSFKTIELLGMVENVAFARYVYDFLQHRIELLWQNYRKTAKAPGKLRKTYILGLLQGVREKLEKDEQKQKPPAGDLEGMGKHKTVSALVVAKDIGLSEFTARRFPRLRKVQYRSSVINCRNTYSAGKTEGRKINIYKTIKQGTGNQGRLLGR